MKLFILLNLFISLSFNAFSQGKKEGLKINWPEEYKWKVGANQETEAMNMLQIVPEKESVNKWTMMGTMMSLKNVQIASTDQVVEMFRESALKESPKAKFTVLEKNDSIANRWVLFKVETPSFPSDPQPESQLYYAMQGELTLYINFIAVKEKQLSIDFVTKWTNVFKSSELFFK